jgi:hypothetical protein
MNIELKQAPSNNSNDPASPFNIIARPAAQLNGGLGFALNKQCMQGQSSDSNASARNDTPGFSYYHYSTSKSQKMK